MPIRRLLIITGIVAGVVATALAAWIILLDQQIVRQFEGRRWNLPAQVYARPLELYSGLRLTADALEAELALLGYTKVAEATRQGTYSRQGSRIELVTRPFGFWDGRQESAAAVLFFGSEGLASLDDRHGAPLPLVRLDPPLIGNIFAVHGEDRIVLPPDEVPPMLLRGLITVEDRDFDRHAGVSFRAIARAMVANIRAGEIEQGGSTLTQQLVRSYFLDNRRTLTRKLREAIMAMLLELHFDKGDILNAYVNEIYLGQAGDRAIHGFGLASQFYFGKPPAELDAAEVALLIAVVRGPSYYDPRRHPERATKRRDMVLDLMARFDVISDEEAAKATASELRIRGSASTFASYNPTFMDLVRRELREGYREDDLLNEGLRIMTTLDPHLQSLAEKELTEGLTGIEKDRSLEAGSLDGAIVVTGAQTPDVLAIVGSRNARLRGFNRALDARRPIGSLVKPVVILAALETGRYHSATLVEDAPLEIRLDTGRTWAPENYDRTYRGPVPMVRVLAESLNIPTVRIGMDVGPKRVSELLKNLGLDTAPRPLPSMLLGAVSLSPLEVAQIYNTLANGGFRAPLRAVRAVMDGSGKPLDRYELKITRAADPAAVQQLTAEMAQVIERGTARGARRWLPPGLQAAAKTGTSDDLRDSWLAGFTSDHVAVVWVGADDNRSTGLTGATGALPIWARLVAGFGDAGYDPVPTSGLADLTFDYETGMLAYAGCGDLVTMPMPKDLLLPVRPDCSPAGLTPAERGMQWLNDLFN